MINVYKNANKERKQYKAKYVSKGTTKNGVAFTKFRINDNKLNQETKQWNNQVYNVFVWKDLPIKDDDMIEFLEIQAIECEEKEWQGQKKIERTIFADVKPSGSSASVQTRVQQATLNEIDDQSEDFPF